MLNFRRMQTIFIKPTFKAIIRQGPVSQFLELPLKTNVEMTITALTEN